ncbi:hypothetical protein [Peribacillus frigoritolerans]|nr:hypothetical protein [Peribacillus frigoritolerans]MDM5306807.1 hypothetical protein [Peribacillus frigoritolerans]
MKKKELGAKFYWMEQAVVARLAKFKDIRKIKGYIPQLNQKSSLIDEN